MLFQPLSSPSMLPPHSSYLDLILQVLGSGHQGLDLVGRERERTRSLWSQASGDSRVSQGWHSPLHGAAPAAAPPAPLWGKRATG